MAHRNECRAVRGRRTFAVRRLLALPLALVLSAAPPPAARAATGEAGAWDGGGDLLGDWAAAGGPGYVPDAGLWALFPPVRAGLVRGGWIAPASQAASPAVVPEPEVGGAPRAWTDSVEVGGPAPGWGGAFGGALATLESSSLAAPAPRTLASFTLHGGDPDLEEAGLHLAHGDSLLHGTLDVSSGQRGAFGPYGLAGRHRWQGAVSARRGPWTLDARIGQRGFASRLASGEEEALARQWGGARLEMRRGAWRFAGRYARAVDARESFAPFLLPSRRDAQESEAALLAERTLGAGTLGFEAAWRLSEVRRTADPAFESEADAGALHAWWSRRLGEGRLALDAALARPSAGGPAYLVPSARYTFGDARVGGEAALVRQLAPVWADLAEGEAAFVQDVWAGRLAARGAVGDLRWSMDGTMGRARGRALAARLPLDELWLRLGYVRDPRRYVFGLATAGAAWRARSWAVGADAFALARDRGESQPLVDPGAGGRAFAELEFGLFKNDLRVRLRADVAAVGERVPEEDPARTLEGYVTSGAQVSFTIGDATFAVRARGLEDRPRPEAWRDLASGEDALGPGRQIQSLLTWRFFN